MVLEPSNYDIWTLRTEKSVVEIFFENYWFLMTQHKNDGFLYDRMILEPSNCNFWTLRTEKPLDENFFEYYWL